MRIIIKIFTIVYLIALPCLFAWAFVLFYEPAPMPVGKRELLTPMVRIGEDFVLRNAYNKPTRCAATIYREMFDSKGFRFWHEDEQRPGATRPDEVFSAVRRIWIPDNRNVSPGPAEYRVTIDWSCNVLQRLAPNTVELPIIHFEIVPPQRQHQH